MKTMVKLRVVKYLLSFRRVSHKIYKSGGHKICSTLLAEANYTFYVLQ